MSHALQNHSSPVNRPSLKPQDDAESVDSLVRRSRASVQAAQRTVAAIRADAGVGSHGTARVASAPSITHPHDLRPQRRLRDAVESPLPPAERLMTLLRQEMTRNGQLVLEVERLNSTLRHMEQSTHAEMHRLRQRLELLESGSDGRPLSHAHAVAPTAHANGAASPSQAPVSVHGGSTPRRKAVSNETTSPVAVLSVALESVDAVARRVEQQGQWLQQLRRSHGDRLHDVNRRISDVAQQLLDAQVSRILSPESLHGTAQSVTMEDGISCDVTLVAASLNPHRGCGL